jgi:hypothetical protein
MCNCASVESKDTAGAPEHEIEVTPAMIEAGTAMLRNSNEDYESAEEIVRDVYSAMQRVRFASA